MRLVRSMFLDKMSREQAESTANEELEARIQQGRPSDEEFEAARRSWVLDDELTPPQPSGPAAPESPAASLGGASAVEAT